MLRGNHHIHNFLDEYLFMFTSHRDVSTHTVVPTCTNKTALPHLVISRLSECRLSVTLFGYKCNRFCFLMRLNNTCLLSHTCSQVAAVAGVWKCKPVTATQAHGEEKKHSYSSWCINLEFTIHSAHPQLKSSFKCIRQNGSVCRTAQLTQKQCDSERKTHFSHHCKG